MDNGRFRNCVSGLPDVVGRWNAICDESDRKIAEWVDALRRGGFKAAHPLDGCVDKERNELTMCYPYFDDGISIGDRVVISRTPNKDQWPIRIIERKWPLGDVEVWAFKAE